jgi:iron complex transport system substrate-binding protein
MKTRYMPLVTACVLAVLLVVISACSNTGKSDSTGGNPAAASPDNTPAAHASFPKTIDSGNGETVTIAKEPQKIALVHWGLTEDLLSFEVPSIAVALPFTAKRSLLGSELYKPYTDKFKEVTVVGENTEVNLEQLLQYEPDLIIAGTVTNQKISKQLSQIAPTVFIDEEKLDVWTDWPAVMMKFGEIMGQEEVAKRAIEKFSSAISQGKEQLKGVEGTVAYVQVREKTMWLQGTQYAGHYYEPLGLKAPAQANGEGEELTLEGLSQINPDHLFLGYFNYTDTSLPALADQWETSEVWKTLKAVKQNQVYKFDGSIAFGFGPISRTYGINAIVNALK